MEPNKACIIIPKFFVLTILAFGFASAECESMYKVSWQKAEINIDDNIHTLEIQDIDIDNERIHYDHYAEKYGIHTGNHWSDDSPATLFGPCDGKTYCAKLIEVRETTDYKYATLEDHCGEEIELRVAKEDDCEPLRKVTDDTAEMVIDGYLHTIILYNIDLVNDKIEYEHISDDLDIRRDPRWSNEAPAVLVGPCGYDGCLILTGVRESSRYLYAHFSDYCAGEVELRLKKDEQPGYGGSEILVKKESDLAEYNSGTNPVEILLKDIPIIGNTGSAETAVFEIREGGNVIDAYIEIDDCIYYNEGRCAVTLTHISILSTVRKATLKKSGDNNGVSLMIPRGKPIEQISEKSINAYPGEIATQYVLLDGFAPSEILISKNDEDAWYKEGDCLMYGSQGCRISVTNILFESDQSSDYVVATIQDHLFNTNLEIRKKIGRCPDNCNCEKEGIYCNPEPIVCPKDCICGNVITCQNDDDDDDDCKMGCNNNGHCIQIGTRVADYNLKYCNLNGDMETVRESGNLCEHNFECENNNCVDNKCYSPGMFKRFWTWIFG
ncbi:MAG: hypothetical protein KKG59_05385 [Nanoarchaeota archaeon]|nr:hypothetical protein [Nanoarchaeota archaeon]